MRHERDIAICTFHRPQTEPPPEIRLFPGDGTIAGFRRAVAAALAANEYDAIHAHLPQMGALFLAVAVSQGVWGRVQPRAVYTVQNSYPNYSRRNRLFHVPIFAAYRQIVFCSNACRESFPAVLQWLTRNRAHVVQNAVDIDRVDRAIAATPPRPEGEPFSVVAIGRLIAIKNPVLLLEAFAAATQPPERLVFVGEGNWRPRLEQRIAALELTDRVTLTGLVSRDEVFRQALHADLYVSTSYGEGLPVAVIEAMACGRPVVLSDIPPHREIAEGTDFIPLLDPDDLAGFVREIERFRAMSPALRAAIGQQCRQLVEQRFGLPLMHRRLDAVYRRLNPGTRYPEGSPDLSTAD